MTACILVTGVNGQVGAAIMALKDDFPFKIVPISRADWDMAKEPEKAVDLIKRHQPDVVINPAAYTNVDGAENDQKTAFAVNALAVRELARACKKVKVPLLHVSTDYVFDGTKETPYTENDLINPINTYGKSKAEGEKLLREMLDEHIILRTSWVFSTTGKNFFTTMQQLGKEFNELKIVDDQRGCPTSADCIANALMKIAVKYLQGDTIPWGTYHYSGRPAVSWYEFAVAIFRKEDASRRPNLVRCASTEYPTNAARPQNSILSMANTINQFKIEPCEWKDFLDINQ